MGKCTMYDCKFRGPGCNYIEKGERPQGNCPISQERLAEAKQSPCPIMVEAGYPESLWRCDVPQARASITIGQSCAPKGKCLAVNTDPGLASLIGKKLDESVSGKLPQEVMERFGYIFYEKNQKK